MNYLGYPVLLIKPTLESNLEYNLDATVTDFGKEYTAFERKEIIDTRNKFSMTFQCNGIAERYALLSFFKTQLGMYGKMWLPSYKRDFNLSRTTTATTLYVQTSEFKTYDNIVDKYICNVEKDNSVYPDEQRFSRIISVTTEGTTEEKIVVDTIIPSLPLDTYLCFMYFVRCDVDSITFQNKEHDTSLVKLTFQELDIAECN